MAAIGWGAATSALIRDVVNRARGTRTRRAYRTPTSPGNRMAKELQLMRCDLAKEVAKIATARMKAKGLRQKDIADQIGKSQVHVSQFLSAKSETNPQLDTVEEIFRALGYRVTIRLTELEA